MTRRRRLFGLALLALVALLALFAWNGLERSWRVPESGLTTAPADAAGPTLRVMAFNLAKLGFHRGGLEFADSSEVRSRLEAVAAVAREHEADLLFLSEVVWQAGTSPVNQVIELAEAAGFHAWTYGDNYSWGLPGLRVRSGNAILSRFPLRDGRVTQLVGGAPFWNPTNNRRLLEAEVQLGDSWLRCASLRNDSIDLANNAAQVEQILSALPDDPLLLAGDVNAEPHERPLALLRESGRFRGVFDGAPTFPSHAPGRRIDTVLVPASFGGVVSQVVLDVNLSDHEPVLVVIEL